jgi:hypothetical protein
MDWRSSTSLIFGSALYDLELAKEYPVASTPTWVFSYEGKKIQHLTIGRCDGFSVVPMSGLLQNRATVALAYKAHFFAPIFAIIFDHCF